MIRRLILLVLLCCLPVAPMLAQADYSSTELPDPRQEKQAKELMETIRCVVCQGQSIADSNAGIAADMRMIIRERIAAGEKPEAIRTWLISRYGDWVSFQPTFSPASAPLWIVPMLALIGGYMLMRSRIKRRRKD